MRWLTAAMLVSLAYVAGGCSGAAFTGVNIDRNQNSQRGADFDAADDGHGVGSGADGADSSGRSGESDGMDISERDDRGRRGGGLGDSSGGRATQRPIDTSGSIGIEGNVAGGLRIPVTFYCSEDSAATIGTTTTRAYGVSYKMFDLSGRLVAEDRDYTRAQGRKNSIMNAKFAVLNLNAVPRDGEYFVAMCDVDDHASCGFTSYLRAQPLDPDDGKGLYGVLGYVSSVRFAGGRMTFATRGATLFDLPMTVAEQEACDTVDSPLMVDMSGEGFAFSGIGDGVSFDLDGSGDKELVSWPKSKNVALLTYDLNGNGMIDGGSELFGNHSIGPDGRKAANGFESLAKYDANGDGRIDARDPVFSKLKLWKDENRNGISEKGELAGLGTAGVIDIRLSYRNVFEPDAHGNEIRQRSEITFQNGSKVRTASIVDVWLKRSINVTRRRP